MKLNCVFYSNATSGRGAGHYGGAIPTDVTEARSPDVTKWNPGGGCPVWDDDPGVRCASSGLLVPGERFEVVRLSHFTHQLESHPQ